ncbi:MAG TPA: M23 family metallopeptidase [Acidimicrobiales bacterium]|jgi:murein DD-endopeptidase MepM/ murein hydrolase activator NlpD
MRKFWPLAVVLVIALAACSSSPSSTTTTGGASGGSAALKGISVPSNLTALVVTPVEPGTFPFLETDGKYHVAYDLIIANASNQPATLNQLDVVDAKDPTKVVASFSGTQLVDPSCPFGNCNRLRQITGQPVTDTVIASGQSRALYVDFTFDSLAAAPKAVLHHIYGTGRATLAATPGPLDYLTTPFDISNGQPRVISPPVKGTNWVALNGCCEPGFPHRDALLPAGGTIGNSQVFAIDFKRANNAGAFYTGDKNQNSSYVDYGQPVYAVADGTVVGVLDGVDANPPGIQPIQIPAEAAQLKIQNADGNHVVLDLGGGVYAMYAHFQKGSIKVKLGDKVKKGQEIALLGNTGNANASHLHFQLMDSPDFVTANPLPYVFDNFVYRGQVPLQEILDADNFVSGTFFQQRLQTGQPRTDQLPQSLAIIDFPS